MLRGEGSGAAKVAGKLGRSAAGVAGTVVGATAKSDQQTTFLSLLGLLTKGTDRCEDGYGAWTEEFEEDEATLLSVRLGRSKCRGRRDVTGRLRAEAG